MLLLLISMGEFELPGDVESERSKMRRKEKW